MIARTFAIAAAFAIAACGTSGEAQQGAVLAKPTGGVPIMVGKKAPLTLALLDAAGRPTMLGKQMGKNGLVLVLTRSASWCPYCKAQLIAIKDVQASLAQRGYKLASLSYDKPQVLAAFVAERDVGYAMLSDQGSKMIDALGLRDPQYGPGSMANGVPYATTLVIGPDGTVKARNVSRDYTARPSNAAILALVDGAKG
jgi:peroxiredoxin